MPPDRDGDVPRAGWRADTTKETDEEINHRRRTHRRTLLAGCSATVGIAHANPPAIYGKLGDQDADAFEAGLAAQGLRSTSSNALKIAGLVCGTMRSRAPSTETQMVAVEREVIATMRSNAAHRGKTVSDDIAWYAVIGAEYHFCPEYT
jgi:hypothetical protein